MSIVAFLQWFVSTEILFVKNSHIYQCICSALLIDITFIHWFLSFDLNIKLSNILSYKLLSSESDSYMQKHAVFSFFSGSPIRPAPSPATLAKHCTEHSGDILQHKKPISCRTWTNFHIFTSVLLVPDVAISDVHSVKCLDQASLFLEPSAWKTSKIPNITVSRRGCHGSDCVLRPKWRRRNEYQSFAYLSIILWVLSDASQGVVAIIALQLRRANWWYEPLISPAPINVGDFGRKIGECLQYRRHTLCDVPCFWQGGMHWTW